MPLKNTLAKALPGGIAKKLDLPKQSATANGVSSSTPTNTNGGFQTDGSGKTPLRTPKTPQDEAIAFFSSETPASGGEPVQVWELWLEDDGGPGQNKSVSLAKASK